jgi:hypothetical protein
MASLVYPPDDFKGRAMTVQHDTQHARFVVPLADGEAELIYASFSDDILELQHT